MPNNPTDNLMAAHRAVMENSQNIGLKSFEAAARLFELQTQAAQAMLATGTEGMKSGPPDGLALARGTAEYAQRVSQVLIETQAEMMQLMQIQAAQLQSLFNEMMASSAQATTSMAQPPGNHGRAGGKRSKSDDS